MSISNFDIERLRTAEKLKIDDSFSPYPTQDGDELFQNGIFEFNITKMLEFIELNSNDLNVIKIEVDDFPKCFSSINESHLDSVDISQPVILAEISPGRYNLIDGNHRKEKARRIGISSIFAYQLNVNQHLRFLTEKDTYLSYIKYWNSKLK